MITEFSFSDHFKTRDSKDLVHEPVGILVRKFDEETADSFVAKISRAHNTGQTIIPVVINSYGGQVYSLLAMYDAIQSSRIPVATIARGKAMSCGAYLALFGTKGHRYAAPEATFMMHDVSSAAVGKVEEIKSDAKEAERLQDILLKLADKHCAQESGHFAKMIHDNSHADWYLNPKEAKKEGMIDHIGTPVLRYRIYAETILELD